MTKPSPLYKGFSKIIYERVGEKPEYKKEVLATKDLSLAFGTALEKMVNQVQGEMKIGVEELKQEKSKKNPSILSWIQREEKSGQKKDIGESKGEKFKM